MCRTGITILLVMVIVGLAFVSGINCSKCTEWNITDMAVGRDGKTIYIIASECRVDTVLLYKSTDGGFSFTEYAMPPDFVAPPRAIAVAPDDSEKVAVVDSTPAEVGVSEGGIMWVSNTLGKDWVAFPPVPNTSAVATTVISDIAVSPARVGMMFGRNYVVCSRDSVGGVTGSVHIHGTGDAWEDLTPVFPIHPMDFTACCFSPGFATDRCIVVVGSTTDATYQDIVNIDTSIFITHVLLEPPGVDSPGDGQIVTSGLALPSDFNPISAAGQVSFVAWDSNPFTYDDIYRVNADTVTKLNVSDAVAGIKSIACAGSIGSGSLIAGMQANTGVYFSADPWSASVKWSPASLAPTGERDAIVAIAPNAIPTCYAGTSGVKSGFFVSTDNSYTFNARGKIAR
jgi:hypothetical protein